MYCILPYKAYIFDINSTTFNKDGSIFNTIAMIEVISASKKHTNQPFNNLKTSFYLTAFCLIALSIFVTWTKFDLDYNHNISISVREDDDNYQFTANYEAANTRRVQQYINKSIEPNGLFRSENDYFDVTTSLADNTKFYIKESPGKLKITLDKKRNSTASYLRIKKMCEGIKQLVAGK